MNIAWNAVNLAIAGFGLYGALIPDQGLTPFESIQQQNSIEKILLFNAGLTESRRNTMKVYIIFMITTLFLANVLSGKDEARMKDNNIGEVFPTLKAETLSGIDILYPDDVKGKTTLILMAFKRETQLKIDSWLKPFLERFEKNTSIHFFEIPMLAKGWKLMSRFIDGGMRSGIPTEKHGNVSTFYGDVDKYCRLLSITDKSDGYVFLLDGDGIIRWRSSGFATEGKLESLYSKIESLKTEKNE
ncbi:MAG: hypothetical protein V2J62_05985 [candidate division KSB1 bacterium]|jgi:hypothetical protein|nr:hypothetical protein [candidate division KSB1 bacterium]